MGPTTELQENIHDPAAKKGDLLVLSHWCPASLLCADYKILSKALATCLKCDLEQIILVNQTYFRPGRSILDNVTLGRDLLELAKVEDTEFSLIAVDQEKAFDQVELFYLWHTLGRFGLNSSFVSKIKVLYQDTESLLKISGNLSAPFKVQWCIWQGCLLSGMPYVLVIEPLLHKIHCELPGLHILNNNNVLHLSAYADDVIVFISNECDVKMLGKNVEDFGHISSAKVNWNKSDALLLGKWESA